MKKFGRRIAAAGICTALAVTGLTGCSSTDKNAVVATMDGTEIKLGEVLVALRYGQASTESYLGGLFGDGNMWEQDLMGTGVPYGVSYKEQMMDSFKEMLVLEKHMSDYNVELTAEEESAIEEAAKQFIADNPEKVLKEMCADEETVARVLTLYTIEDKMRTAIEADVDTEVSDEEAAQKTIQYALFAPQTTTDEEGNTVEPTDEEKEAVKQQAQDVIDEVKGGKTLEEALEAVEKSVLTNSYGSQETTLSEALTAAADELEDGEIAAEPVETDNGWYVVQMQSTFDEEATASRKEAIISERESELYNEVVEGWEPESFEINSKVWDKVTFEDKFTVKQAETEAASETEVSEDSETGSEAESESETEAGSEAESESEIETGSEAESESETETETELVSENETESETK